MGEGHLSMTFPYSSLTRKNIELVFKRFKAISLVVIQILSLCPNVQIRNPFL